MFNRKSKANKTTSPVSLITVADKKSPISEQFRTIRTNIQFSMIDHDLQTLVITSSGPSEGKSTTAANLAVVFANSGSRTLLVDADMRKPTVAKSFVLDNYKGLSTLLSGHNNHLDRSISESEVENLWVLPSGPKPPNPSEMLGSQRMVQLIAEMKEKFDLIIFDMPPVVTVTDAQILASQVDGTIMIVRQGVSQKQAVLKAKELLEIVDANILGVVYNGATKVSDQGYYYGV